jgi:hypothetical protein
MMRFARWILLIPVVAMMGCNIRYDAGGRGAALTAEQKTAVEKGVRSFMRDVADDVTREGPAAWSKVFADRPEFFMASDGRLMFANGQGAMQGIQDVKQMIKQIELHWGEDLRVDALTPDLAVVGTTWQEQRVEAQGHQVNQGGYFTGVVEQHNGRWQFRDAHWSVAAPAAAK